MKKLIIAILIVLALGTISYGSGLTASIATYDIKVNNQKVAVQPYNLNGTTLLPVRQLSDALGIPINWNNATKSVEINTVDIERLKEACVMIYTDDGKTQVQGSGVYTDYGEVTSALHGIDGGRTNVRTSDGTKLTVEGQSKELDIMTLASEADVKPVKIGDSDDVKTGNKVILIGSPEGKDDVVTYVTVKK